jgi:NAD-dependent SIR2 family protein deacetylase
VEAHGSIHWLQPLRATGELFRADDVTVSVDTETMRALPPLPHHPKRDELLRPNILMFGDGGWDSQRAEEQEHRFDRWLEELRGDRLVVVECGAGSAVPTVRWQSEQLVAMLGGALVRINTREPHVPARPGRQIGAAAAGGDGIGISLGALEALRAIAARLPQGDTGPSA